ncbi:hypothetical protein EUTSA_v10002382mg [Eutrema salsugineum]|uniref:Knl1 C-terminal RWD domain-containing protein n=1 Tax=Eutrema salsugineum TaxID=72664 RepID=V4MX95_EUTSA|nr:hypothetical protein EUTSA_v10002382mg [Eutrema salsugineum]
MASEKPEDPMNISAGTDEETIAQRRKRLRRVSFADREITSVHIFKRDEDYETPPNSSASKPQNGEQADTSESEDKVIRFFGELADSEDTGGDGDAEEDEAVVEKFLRPKNSPSSGGSTIGSARSDDEDNFFGPVSSHFINPGRLSDATISEEHHDITMDSTAFSMHFRSLAMSESGDVRTPTSSQVPVEEKTPTQVTSRSDTGSAMVLTYPKKLFPKSPLPVDKGSGGGDSNDMSLVGEDSRKYDYGHITPALAALLGDESDELLPASSNTPVHDFSLPPQNGCIPMGQSCKESGILLHESGSQRYTNEAFSSSSTNRRRSILPQSFSCVTPSPPKHGGSFMSRETLALVESLSTIQKSKSRLGLIPPSPASALSQRIEKSMLQLSGHRSMTTPLTTGREEVGVRKHTDIPITNLEDLLSKDDDRTPVSEKKGIPDQRSCGALSPAVDSSNLFACISPEGNTNSGIEAKSPNAKTSALMNVVTLHDQEQHSKAIGNSETGEGHATKDCASNCSPYTLSDKVDSLLRESCVLLSETGFLNGSAQQKEKDSVLTKNQDGTNNISAARCESEVILTGNFPAVVAEDLPNTSGSSSMDRSKDDASHAKGPSRLKRKAKDVDRAARSGSPKVRKSTVYISNPVMDHPDGNYDANDCRVIPKQVINWVEIPGKVSVEINQMLAPLSDKLNSRQICKLEDILTHLKKVHLCEMLCLQIKSQKVCDDLSGAKTKRRAESRSSLCKLAYEKAKLELLQLKQEIMMKKFQAVSTGVQTSEILKLNCAKLLHQHDLHSTGLFNPEKAHEDTNSKGAEITEEIEVLDSKIKNLIKCFPTCDKMAGEPAYADTITIAEDKLKKKMNCRFIRQEILAWKVESLGEKNDCQSIVLNYRGLINQRLTLKPGHASCVMISNSLSDAFTKHFPDMNVSVAFNSLFNAEYPPKYVGSNTLLEITQKTSLVLHNMLDVAEELQLARMEIPNLVQGKFDSPSAEQLHLQITFIDCKNLRKIIMILDMACLIHGKYPGDIIPCELISGTNRDGAASKQLMNEIESAMDGVGVGSPRILKLCRCVSKLLQSQSRR